jgi:signal transduction histidine kinase
MKKKWLIGIGIGIGVVLLFFANRFYEIEYNTTLLNSFQSDSWLTTAEKEYLKNHGNLIYGSDQNSPPLRYVNPQTGQYEGLVIDYVAALSLELGNNIQTKPMIWNDALSALSRAETDLCDMYASKERTKIFLFTNPIYYQRGAILVKRSEKDIHIKSELEGKKIAAIQGDYVFEYLQDHYKKINTLPTTDLRTAIHALEKGQVDAVLGDESVINFYLTQENLSQNYILLTDYLYEREAVIGVEKSNEMLLSILNKGIHRLNKQGTMDRIYEKWFVSQPLITKNTNSEKYWLIIQFVMFIAAMTALGLYYWNRELKREVIRQTTALTISKQELEKSFAEYKHAENRMMQSSKMAAVGQLAAGIAHEIRTPLGIIRNATYLLKRESETDGRLKQIESIEQSVSRANKTIDNLLNFSQISDNQLSHIPMRTFIENLWQINHKAWQTQGIEFELSCESMLSLKTYLESLKHVLLNLFSNAVDAMPEGGILSVVVEEDQLEGSLFISVRDSGVGMSQKTIEQLYDPFFTTKSSSKGTGLGLYIVYNEVQKMGGKIKAESQIGQGSCITIELRKND